MITTYKGFLKEKILEEVLRKKFKYFFFMTMKEKMKSFVF
jgi:hypothetical protein